MVCRPHQIFVDESTMSECENALMAAAAVVILCGSQRRRRPRRLWSRPSLLINKNSAGHKDVIESIIEDDDCVFPRSINEKGVFQNFFRMTRTDFKTLLQMIGADICKSDTKFRQSISVTERLGVTLRFLATGDSYSSLGCTFKISKQAISVIVPEVYDALIGALSDYIKVSIPV